MGIDSDSENEDIPKEKRHDIGEKEKLNFISWFNENPEVI